MGRTFCANTEGSRVPLLFRGQSRRISIRAGAVLPANIVRKDDDGDRTLGSLLEKRTFGLLLVVSGVRIGKLHLAVSEDLETIVEVGSRREGLGAKTGARITDLNQIDRLGTAIFDDGSHERGMAAAQSECSKQYEDVRKAHTV